MSESGVTGFSGHAAVVVVVRSSERGRAVLLTERAAHLEAHPGEIALPGGKWEPGDSCLEQTALRETEEEVGVASDALRLIGRLPLSYTGRGVPVTPFVAELIRDVPLVLDPAELSAAFWVPDHALLADERLRTDIFELRGREYWAPAYHYLGHRIWGFTARVLVQFMNAYWQAEISRDHASPVFRYKL